MPTTAKLAKDMGVVVSTAISWSEQYDLVAAVQIQRSQQNDKRELTTQQLDRILRSYKYYKANKSAISPTEAITEILGRDRCLKTELQQSYDARVNANKVSTNRATQIPAKPINPQIQQPRQPTQGTVTSISRTEAFTESNTRLSEMMEMLIQQQERYFTLFRESMQGMFEQWNKPSQKASKSKQLIELEEQVKLSTARLTLQRNQQKQRHLETIGTPAGRWLKIVSDRVVMVGAIIIFPLLVVFLIASTAIMIQKLLS